MRLVDLVSKGRSYRKFKQANVDEEDLIYAVNNARLCPSMFNIQSFNYFCIQDKKKCNLVTELLTWGSLYKYSDNGDGPSAYILIMNDNSIYSGWNKLSCNLGIVAQTMCLSLVERGYATCMLQSFSVEKIRELFGLVDKYEPLLFIAIGKSAENIFIETVSYGASTKYYNDEMGHHVPKYELKDMILLEKGSV